jgi:hypothetical protein
VKLESYNLTPTGGEIIVSSGGKRYKKGGWGRNPLESQPLHDLKKLLQAAGVPARTLRKQDPHYDPLTLAIGGKGFDTDAEISFSSLREFAGEALNRDGKCRFHVSQGWNLERQSWRPIPARTLEALNNALSAILGPQQEAP